MNLEIYTLCHQEAKIIPYFMRHYTRYGTVFMYEGHSTDGSRELARSLGAITLDLDTENQTRDDLMTDIKNNCWKSSQADWVIVCDMDEFIYHPDLINYLSTIPDTIISPRTFEMISDKFPDTPGQIYDEVQYGFDINRKFFLFKPQFIKSMNYGCGAHDAQPQGQVFINFQTEVICMHFRHLGIDHIVERNAYYAKRMSEVNKRHGWGWHVTQPRKAVEDYFNEHRKDLIKVI